MRTPEDVPAWLGVIASIEEVDGRAGLGRASLELLRRAPGALKGIALAFELHGPHPEAHAQVRRSLFAQDEAPESFDATVTAIDLARAHGVRVIVASTVSRSSMRVLRDQASLMARLGVGAWCLVAPWREPALEAPQLPRVALTTPFVLDAAVRARRSGLTTWLVGFPLCVLGPHAPLALASSSPATGAPCQACPSRTSCPGIGARYRARFGGGELFSADASPSPVPALMRALLDGIA